ncbi:MAG: hypothetical protein QJR00_00350 [Bacillota bacterium]|nr:hypothetical protein [Bacillota bacterium]
MGGGGRDPRRHPSRCIPGGGNPYGTSAYAGRAGEAELAAMAHQMCRLLADTRVLKNLHAQRE